MDPRFGITFDEIKTRFKGTNKISKDATLLLSEKDVFFEGLDLGAKTLICKNGQKTEAGQTIFEKSSGDDAEIY